MPVVDVYNFALVVFSIFVSADSGSCLVHSVGIRIIQGWRFNLHHNYS